MRKVKTILNKIIFKIYYLINPIKASRMIGVEIGVNCRLVGKVNFSTEPYLIKIGDHVSITNSSFLTHDGGVWIFREEFPRIDVIGKITIGNNVFIGDNCIILPNVKIEDNVIVGTGSIVTKTLETGWVYAGVPAKKIKTIEEYKQQVMKEALDIKGLSYEKKKQYLHKLYS